MGGAGERAAPVPIKPQFEVCYREGLCAETWRQVFESGDVLIHDLLGSQSALIHRVLLEGPHKVCKHSLDPDFSQEVVSGDLSGKRPWNAL